MTSRPYRPKVLIAGVTGLVGFAAARRFARDADYDVVGVSRRRPAGLAHVEHISVDLTERNACAEVFGPMDDVTHLVYAALYEMPGLISGWRHTEQIETNHAMFSNLLDPLLDAAPVEHVSLLQGTKAYGAHVEPMVVPAREHQPRHDHENFYWRQEDELRARQDEAGFSFTIWRPQVIFGRALGANMNPIPALGTYAAVLRAQGRPLDYPGGTPMLSEAVDADLLADAIHWGTTSPGARDQTFNITNGDVFSLRNAWPAIADAFGMDVGDDVPMATSAQMAELEPLWHEVHDRFDLTSPRELAAFVGQSFIYLDMLTAVGMTEPLPPALVSTIKLRTAGYGGCVDTEDMFRRLIGDHQRIGWLPPRDW